MVKIVDGRIRTENLLAGEVTNPKMDSLFQKSILTTVPDTGIWVTFPTAYADTPVVIAVPGSGNTWARVISVGKTSFNWQGAAGPGPGTASWLAWGHKT